MNAANVIKALTLLLNAKYPESKINNKEIKSPVRPCGFIKLITAKRQRLSEAYTQTTIALDVIYFAESRYQGYLDLVKKQGELSALFDNPLKVNGSYLAIEELEFNLNEEDYVLNTLFNVVISEYTDIKDVTDVENIELDPENAGCIYDMENLEGD